MGREPRLPDGGSLAFVFPRFFFFFFFFNETYHLFLCNIASSNTWEVGRTLELLGKPLLGCASCFPTLLVFSQLTACLDEAILHGNALYIFTSTLFVADAKGQSRRVTYLQMSLGVGKTRNEIRNGVMCL